METAASTPARLDAHCADATAQEVNSLRSRLDKGRGSAAVDVLGLTFRFLSLALCVLSGIQNSGFFFFLYLNPLGRLKMAIKFIIIFFVTITVLLLLLLRMQFRGYKWTLTNTREDSRQAGSLLLTPGAGNEAQRGFPA